MAAVLFEDSFWTREYVEKDKDRVYLFGDNTYDRTLTNHIPKSTQAVIRGLPNAIGIDTKKDRWRGFLTDDDFPWFIKHVDDQIELAKSFGKTIVIPKDGIGTGKAELPTRTPECYKYLKERLEELLCGG